MGLKRYYLDQDGSGHWYIIPEDKQAEWNAWSEIPEEDERSWDPPGFAERIDGGPQHVTFSEPKAE